MAKKYVKPREGDDLILSDTPIPEIMGTLGLNKNQVVGRRHFLKKKLGIPLPGRPEAKPGNPKKKKPNLRVVENLPPQEGHRPQPCKFPIGDPKDADYRACCEPTRRDGPYCDEHRALCYYTYVPNKKRRNDYRHVKARYA